MSCNDCQIYDQRGENYCRMCGEALTKGLIRRAQVAIAYLVNEKTCGYCGRAKHRGRCKPGRRRDRRPRARH